MLAPLDPPLASGGQRPLASGGQMRAEVGGVLVRSDFCSGNLVAIEGGVNFVRGQIAPDAWRTQFETTNRTFFHFSVERLPGADEGQSLNSAVRIEVHGMNR